MATRVWESCVLEFGVETVWSTLRSLDFAWDPRVESCEVEGKKPATSVGSQRTVTYKKGSKDKQATVQRLKITEISDDKHLISWDMISSEPSADIMSVSSTIILRRVTDENRTFVEWINDFSSDVTQNQIQDAKFKRLDAFGHLESHLEEQAAKKYSDDDMKKFENDLQTIFSRIDKSGDDVVSWHELETAISSNRNLEMFLYNIMLEKHKKAGQNVHRLKKRDHLTRQYRLRLFREIDTDNSKTINWKEFRDYFFSE